MRYQISDGLRFGLGLLGLLVLISVLGFGWLIKSLLFFLLFFSLAPVVIVIALQLWLKTRLVTAPCPLCGEVSTALKSQSFTCPNCTEPLEVSSNRFVRLSPPGTIDVEGQTID